MNFTAKVREELFRTSPQSEREAAAEIIGYLVARDEDGDETALSAHLDDAFRRRVAQYPALRDFSVDQEDGEFWVRRLYHDSLFDWVRGGDHTVLRALLRGAFFAAGSITDPSGGYHAEVSLRTSSNAAFLQEMFAALSLPVGRFDRGRRNIILYMKDSHRISDFLTAIGAVHSTLAFEEQIVVRSVNNRINRAVNCETANITKTVDAGLRQLAAIERLKESGRLDMLPETLYETALLRMANPDASLGELVLLSGGRLTKSGLNHRLKRLVELAES